MKKEEWAIYNTTEELWWSNSDGWGSFSTRTNFSSDEKEKFNLPLDGMWIRLAEDD